MNKEPQFETQLDEYAQEEVIDISVYSHLVLCESTNCSNVRYVKPQDKKQVTYCKPCARAARLKDRAERAKIYRKRDKKTIPE